jgi:hypothetical protein
MVCAKRPDMAPLKSCTKMERPLSGEARCMHDGDDTVKGGVYSWA